MSQLNPANGYIRDPEVRQHLAAPEAVLGAVPELEFDQTVILTAEVGKHELLQGMAISDRTYSNEVEIQHGNSSSGNSSL